MNKDTQKPKLQQIEVTLQDIWQATRPIIQSSKKQYNRKQKHKKITD